MIAVLNTQKKSVIIERHTKLCPERKKSTALVNKPCAGYEEERVDFLI